MKPEEHKHLYDPGVFSHSSETRKDSFWLRLQLQDLGVGTPTSIATGISDFLHVINLWTSVCVQTKRNEREVTDI